MHMWYEMWSNNENDDGQEALKYPWSKEGQMGPKKGAMGSRKRLWSWKHKKDTLCMFIDDIANDLCLP